MTTDFQQTDGTPAAAVMDPHCSGNSDNGDEEGNQAERGGTAGSTARTVTVDVSAADLNAIWMEIINIDNYGGEAGDWTVRINVTGSNHQISLDEIWICRLNSSNVNQETLGNLTGIGENWGSTGVKTHTVNQGSATTINPGDKIVIIFALDNGQAMTNDIAYTPDQITVGPGDFVGVVNEVTIRDTILPTDTPQRVADRPRTFQDDIALVDALRRGIESHIGDSVLTTDLIRMDRELRARDTLLVDLIQTTLTTTRDLTGDRIVISDRMQKDTLKFLFEAVLPVDSVTADKISEAVEVFTRLVQDTVLVFDTRTSDRLHREIDSVIPVDQTLSHAERQRLIQDAISIFEFTIRTVGRRLPRDQVVMSDRMQKDLLRFFFETVLLTDAVTADRITPEVVIERLIQDALLVFDERRSERIHRQIDTLLPTDQVLSHTERQRLILDVISTLDFLQREIEAHKRDTVLPTDERTADRSIRLLESIIVSDFRRSLREHFFFDALSISDQTLVHAERLLMFLDAVVISDRAVRAREMFFRDPIPVFDAVTATRITEAAEVILRDTIVMADFVRKTRESRFFDPVDVADTLGTQREVPLEFRDVVELFEVVRSHVERIFAQRDTVLITDEIRREIVLHLLSAILVFDTVTATKIVEVVGEVVERIVTDSIVISDFLRMDQSHRLLDQIQIVDQILFNVERLRTLTDVVLIFDTVLTEAQRERLLRDVVLLEDAFQRLIELHFFDTFPMTDSVLRLLIAAIFDFIRAPLVGIVDFLGARARFVDFLGATADTQDFLGAKAQITRP